MSTKELGEEGIDRGVELDQMFNIALNESKLNANYAYRMWWDAWRNVLLKVTDQCLIGVQMVFIINVNVGLHHQARTKFKAKRTNIWRMSDIGQDCDGERVLGENERTIS